MPACCAVINCSKRAQRDQVRFFRIPAALKDRGEMLDLLSKRRRECWVRSLNRGNLSATFIKYARICSNHFITGCPADLQDKNNPDWIPTQNMGYISAGKENEESVWEHNQSTKQEKRTNEDVPKVAQAVAWPSTEDIHPKSQEDKERDGKCSFKTALCLH